MNANSWLGAALVEMMCEVTWGVLKGIVYVHVLDGDGAYSLLLSKAEVEVMDVEVASCSCMVVSGSVAGGE